MDSVRVKLSVKKIEEIGDPVDRPNRLGHCPKRPYIYIQAPLTIWYSPKRLESEMTTAAARLGLRLAATNVREKISSSLFMRRSSTSAKKEGTISEMESELNKEKSLYLCFLENGFYFVNQVVRPIRLNSDDDNDDGKGEEYLPEAVYKTSEEIGEWRFSGRLGSQILFPLGHRHISRVDTSTRPIKFEDSTIEFSSPKIDPVLVELNGKLYCIDKDNPYRPFEVFDFKWRALDKPPFSVELRRGPLYTSVLEGSNKILAWEQGKAGVFYFDATKPENGWKQTPFSFANALPFLGYHGRPPIFIHNHHPDLGDFYLMFSYDYREPLFVSPFFMFRNCESFQGIGYTPIQLPAEFCSKHLRHFDIHADYEFVRLGGQKICLVLNKFFSDHLAEGKNRGILLLITFEYEIIPNGFEVDIRTRFLWTRRFRYHPKPADDKEVYRVHLTGAFVL